MCARAAFETCCAPSPSSLYSEFGDGVSIGRLSLGTAQLGMPYGISGEGRSLSQGEVTSILQTAVDLGITAIDTAPGYGVAEQRIGHFLSEHDLVADISVCTKLPAIGAAEPSRLEHIVEERVMASLQRLRCDCIDGYLIHDIADLHAYGDRLVDALVRQREKGRILDLGLSVYAPEDLETLADYPALNVVQHPFNLLDRRLLDGDGLTQLRSAGTKLQLRSVLLQGLLAMAPETVPESMGEARAAVTVLRALLAELELPLPQAAVAYVLSLDADRVIVAAESADQLGELLTAVDLALPSELDDLLDGALDGLSAAVIDPRSWPRPD